MKVAVVGGERTVWGFALAGVKETRVASGADEAEAAITGWTKDPGIGVVLVESAIADTIRPYLARVRKEKKLYPLVIELEMPGTELSRIGVEEELLRAVGMMMGIRE